MKSETPNSDIRVAVWSTLADREPTYALAAGVDLVVIRFDDKVSVLYGRCHHRGALLADGFIDGPNLICGVHNWDYRYDTGISEYNNEEALAVFSSRIDEVFSTSSNHRGWSRFDFQLRLAHLLERRSAGA